MSERTITAQDLGTGAALTLVQDSGGRLYADDERVWSISALDDGIVALTTGIRAAHISAADYWRLLHGDAYPDAHAAGRLAARLAHIERDATALIAAIVHEPRISPASYPAVWERVAALRTALGVVSTAAAAHELVEA